MTPTQLFIKKMRDKGKQLKKSFHIYRGEDQDCCPICGVDLCRLADEIESKLEKVEEEAVRELIDTIEPIEPPKELDTLTLSGSQIHTLGQLAVVSWLYKKYESNLKSNKLDK